MFLKDKDISRIIKDINNQKIKQITMKMYARITENFCLELQTSLITPDISFKNICQIKYP